MKVSLINEGTYPFTHGGVSVWCHSLIGSMPQHDFDLVSIVANHNNTLRWQPHPNVVSLNEVTLWPPVPRKTRGHVTANERSSFVMQALDHFYEALCRGNAALGSFESALRELHQLDLQHVLGVMQTEPTVERLFRRWNKINPDKPISLYDALMVNDIVSHLIRPLWYETRPVDLNHAVANGLAILVCMAGKWRYNTPFVVSEHGVYLRERYLSSDREQLSDGGQIMLLLFYRMVAAMGYKNAKAIYPVSDFNARWARYQGAPKSKIRTIYNGVSAQRFAPIETEPTIPTISWVGRIDPVKDLETLIRAFAVVRLTIPNATLRLFGPVTDGCEAYGERITALASQMLAPGSYRFEGAIEDSRVGYSAGHVVALSSKSEGLPYTVLEAMMCGRVTVSTDVGGVSELVGNGGVVVPAGSPAKLAEALVELLQNRDKRVQVGQAARERALKHFQTSTMIEQYERAYSKVVSSNSLRTALKAPAKFVLTGVPSKKSTAQVR